MKTRLAIAIVIVFAAAPAFAGTDWGKVCASYGLTPRSPDFKSCVSSMMEADKATGGTLEQSMKTSAANAGPQQSNAAQQNAQMREQIRQQIEQQQKAAANNLKCVTTVNGTNTATQCP